VAPIVEVPPIGLILLHPEPYILKDYGSVYAYLFGYF
jgi:hypothetical protein